MTTGPTETISFIWRTLVNLMTLHPLPFQRSSRELSKATGFSPFGGLMMASMLPLMKKPSKEPPAGSCCTCSFTTPQHTSYKQLDTLHTSWGFPPFHPCSQVQQLALQAPRAPLPPFWHPWFPAVLHAGSSLCSSHARTTTCPNPSHPPLPGMHLQP